MLIDAILPTGDGFLGELTEWPNVSLQEVSRAAKFRPFSPSKALPPCPDLCMICVRAPTFILVGRI